MSQATYSIRVNSENIEQLEKSVQQLKDGNGTAHKPDRVSNSRRSN